MQKRLQAGRHLQPFCKYKVWNKYQQWEHIVGVEDVQI